MVRLKVTAYVFHLCVVMACCEACSGHAKNVSQDRVGHTATASTITLDHLTQLILPSYLSDLITPDVDPSSLSIAGTTSPISVTPSRKSPQARVTFAAASSPARDGFAATSHDRDTILIHTTATVHRQDTATASSQTVTSTTSPPLVSSLPDWWAELRLTLMVLAIAFLMFLLICLLRQ